MFQVDTVNGGASAAHHTSPEMTIPFLSIMLLDRSDDVTQGFSMHGIGRGLSLLALGLLVGCATAAQRQAKSIGAEMKAAESDVKECIETVHSEPEYASFATHTPAAWNDLTLLQMADQSKVMPSDVPLLSEMHSKSMSCRHTFLQHVAHAMPLAAPVFIEGWTRSDEELLKLAQQKLTWGEYNTNVKQIISELSPKLMAVGKEMDQQLQYAHSAELAQRQAALSETAQYLQTQQLINSMNRPVLTNCSASYNNVSCISR